MKGKREYPYGRIRRNGVAQPFRSKLMAEKCAEIMERMTGDFCDTVQRGPTWFLVLREIGEGRTERA
jgi:hypothetical protein